MPFAPSPSVGLIALTTIKLAGYSLFGGYLNKLYKPDKPKAFSFGLIRTVVGLLVGAIAASICLQVLSLSLTVFLLLLIPIRFGEWFLVIWLFFDKTNALKSNKIYDMFKDLF